MAARGPSDPTLLHRYHVQPGKTVALLEPFRDPQGRSSYEVLADEVSALPRDGLVLDLACGDGYLLAMLAARGFRHLAGVDQSAPELAAARERLGQEVELHCQDACSLPFPPRSVEMVVCHMALMLMESAPAVLAEVARVLRPGGPLVAVINRPYPDLAWEIYWQELHRIATEAGLGRLQLGNPDLHTAAGVRELFADSPFDADRLHLQNFVVQARAAPRRIWSLFELTYDVFRLSEPDKEKLGQRVLPAWEPLIGEGGLLVVPIGMRLLRCPTRAPAGKT